MMKRRLEEFLIMLAIMVAAGCSDESGSDAEQIARKFSSSGCLNEPSADTSVSVAISEMVPDELLDDYKGLECITWQVVSADSLKIGLSEQEINCAGIEKAEAAYSSSGELEIYFRLPDVLANCMCRFDVEVDLDGVDTGSDLNLALKFSSAEWLLDEHMSKSGGAYIDSYIKIPLSENNNGIRCRYNAYLENQNGASVQYCSDSDSICPEDAECISVTNNAGTLSKVCMLRCDENNPCSHGLMECKDGFCDIEQPWEIAPL